MINIIPRNERWSVWLQRHKAPDIYPATHQLGWELPRSLALYQVTLISLSPCNLAECYHGRIR